MKKLLTIFIVLIACNASMAQYSLWSFNYNPATPVGDLKTFVDATSWRGWSFEGRKFMTDEVSLGGWIGYNGFYEERSRSLYDIENVTVNAITWRYVTTIPVLVNTHYYIGEGWVRPFVGVGVGLYFIEQELQFSSFRISDNYTRFGIAPEAGVFVPFGFGSNAGLLLSAKLHQVFYEERDIGNLNYVNYNFGIAFSY